MPITTTRSNLDAVSVSDNNGAATMGAQLDADNTFLPIEYAKAVRAIGRSDKTSDAVDQVFANMLEATGEDASFLLNPRFDKAGIQQNMQSTCTSDPVYRELLSMYARGQGGNYWAMYKMGKKPTAAQAATLSVVTEKGLTPESALEMTDKNQKYIWNQGTSIMNKMSVRIGKLIAAKPVLAARAEHDVKQAAWIADCKSAELNGLPAPKALPLPAILRKVERDQTAKQVAALTAPLLRLEKALQVVRESEDLCGLNGEDVRAYVHALDTLLAIGQRMAPAKDNTPVLSDADKAAKTAAAMAWLEANLTPESALLGKSWRPKSTD